MNTTTSHTVGCLKNASFTLYCFLGYKATITFTEMIISSLWSKNELFKSIESTSEGIKKLQTLWAKTKKKDRKVPEASQTSLFNQLKATLLAYKDWILEEDDRDACIPYIKLSKTFKEIFCHLFTKKRHLIKTEETIYWATAVRICNNIFKLRKEIKVPLAV